MAAAIALRDDFSGDDLRRSARASGDAKQVRRLLALAVILDGGTRTEAARLGGVGLQIVRDWVLRFNAEGPEGLVDRKAPGKAPTLTTEQRVALARVVEAGPEPWRDGVVRWRRIDLVQWLWEEFRVSVSEATVGRELRALGFRKLSARPRHYAQGPEAAEAFKKASRSAWRRSGPRIAEPTPFALEGTMRHAIRGALLLSTTGWSWHVANAAAISIVDDALRACKVKRPTWLQGQPEYVEPLVRICLRCRRAIEDEGRWKFCSEVCRSAV